MSKVLSSDCAAKDAAHPHSRVCARIVLTALSISGLGVLAWVSFAQPVPRLVYNPSDSVPVGWYRVEPIHRHPGYLPVGSIVLTQLSADAAALAARRGYLPARVPLLKRVGAIAPQHVCIVGDQLRIDGVPMAAVLSADRLGRALPVWQPCRPLAEGELFLLSATHPASFDSRYFGPVSASAVIGVAHPVLRGKQP